MRILVACEFSARVRWAFQKRGHDAWSCDLLESRIEGNHFQGDVLEHLDDGWDMMIAHPPCTYLTNAGVRHLHSVRSRLGNLPEVHGDIRWLALRDGVNFFNKLKNADIPRICIENPIPHRYARQLIGNYSQLIQPYMFGDPETKATCLWLKNLPKLIPTNIVLPIKGGVSHGLSPSKDRARIRSITYTGIAEAMADQWGGL